MTSAVSTELKITIWWLYGSFLQCSVKPIHWQR